MSIYEDTVSGLARLIRPNIQSKTTAYDTPATVRRVENGVAYVHIEGGVDETPVQLTIDANAGDTVQVRVSGGRAWITGNSSAPPTDDRTAKQAVQTAKEAHVEAAKAVEQTAENTRAITEQSQSIQNNYRAITRIDTTAVTGVVVQYAKSDSPTVAPTRGWSDASPIWESGKYIWQRTVTTIDGEQIISNVSCIQGAKGADGADGTSVTILGHYDTYAELAAAHPTGSSGDAYMVGADLYVWNGSAWENVGQIQGPQGDTGPKGDTGRGIASITPEYYLSTSNTTQTGGSWSATVPAYVEDRYYWTRSKIMWDDSDTPTYTTPVLDTAITNANSAAYQALRRAGNAEDVANATKQYFWEDNSGVHIASEPEAPTATRNMLLNSLGMLFRRGANNLLALLTGTNPSVNIYDGQGNAESNVLAKFGADGVRIGKSDGTNIEIAPNKVKLTAENGEEALHMDYMGATDASDNVDYGVNLTDEHYNSSISLSPASTDGNFDGHLSYTATMGDFEWRYRNKTLISLNEAGFTYASVSTGATLFNIDPTGEIWVKGQDVFAVHPFVYEQVTVNVSFAAGTIGSRGAAVSLGSTAKSGYTFLDATILSHTNTTQFSVDIVRNSSTNTVSLIAYRATAQAVTDAQVIVRKMWVSSKLTGAAE